MISTETRHETVYTVGASNNWFPLKLDFKLIGSYLYHVFGH